jgi:hypothetical protein
MDMFDLQEFVHSVAMLAMLIPLYLVNRFFSGRRKIWFVILLGGFIALIGIVDMHMILTTSMVVVPDARSVLLIITGAVLGPLPMGIAGIAMLVYRIIIGGAGLIRGIVLIILSMVVGYVCSKQKYYRTKVGLKFFFLGVIGTFFTVVTLLIFIPHELAYSIIYIYCVYFSIPLGFPNYRFIVGSFTRSI